MHVCTQERVHVCTQEGAGMHVCTQEGVCACVYTGACVHVCADVRCFPQLLSTSFLQTESRTEPEAQ